MITSPPPPIISVADRVARPYHRKEIGKSILIVALDSGHVVDFAGAQATWLEETLSQSPHITFKFASYHVPLYPSALIGGKTWDDDQTSANARGRKIWVPIFDKYGLTAGFENHVHSFKRSAPMLNSRAKKDGRGVVYFGDGCWGVTSFDIPTMARMVRVCVALPLAKMPITKRKRKRAQLCNFPEYRGRAPHVSWPGASRVDRTSQRYGPGSRKLVCCYRNRRQCPSYIHVGGRRGRRRCVVARLT